MERARGRGFFLAGAEKGAGEGGVCVIVRIFAGVFKR